MYSSRAAVSLQYDQIHFAYVIIVTTKLLHVRTVCISDANTASYCMYQPLSAIGSSFKYW